MIYFIHNSSERAIKVGYSADPWARLAALQTGSPSPLYLLGVIAGDRSNEARWHQHFRSANILNEWFKEAPVFECFREHLFPYSIVRLREIDWDGLLKHYLKPIAGLTLDEALMLLFIVERSAKQFQLTIDLHYERFTRIFGNKFERRFGFMDNGESLN
jgi:hypothetical protein